MFWITFHRRDFAAKVTTYAYTGTIREAFVKSIKMTSSMPRLVPKLRPPEHADFGIMKWPTSAVMGWSAAFTQLANG